MRDVCATAGASFDRAREHLDAGDLRPARAAAEDGWRRLQRAAGAEAEALRIEGALLLASIAFEDGDDEGAFAWLQRVHEVAPDDSEALQLEARFRMHRWELDRAEDLLWRCDPPPELRAAVAYDRAIVAELRGDAARAERLYAEAARLDPKGCPHPVRIDDDEARALLEGLIDAMPSDVRATFENLQVDIVDVPDPRIDRAPDTDPLVLGLYHGVPQGEKEATPWAVHDRVRIFKRNIERLALEQDELVEQLRITLLHELGHHLGWDEDDLEARGLA